MADQTPGIIPADPLLNLALDQIQARMQELADRAVAMARETQGLGPEARYDVNRRAWVLPPASSPAPGPEGNPEKL